MNKQHIATLDGLRGLAALLVLLSHFPTVGFGSPVNARVGDYGVLLFFVLSGFLMGYLYLDQRFDRQSVTSYIAARAARIVPLYYAVVLASFLLSKLLGPQFVYFMTTFEFARLMLFTGHIAVFWSIGPEVQFYAAFVGIWYLVASGRLGSLAWIVAGSLAATLVLLGQAVYPGVILPSKLHIFLLGLAVAMLFARSRREGDETAYMLAQILAALLIVLICLPHGPLTSLFYPPEMPGDVKHNAIFGELRVILPVAAILLAFTRETAFSRVLLGNRPARLAGRYSFSIYLLHEPVMAATRGLLEGRSIPGLLLGVIAIAATFAVAAASFALIERPSQRAVRRAVTRWSDRQVVVPPPH